MLLCHYYVGLPKVHHCLRNISYKLCISPHRNPFLHGIHVGHLPETVLCARTCMHVQQSQLRDPVILQEFVATLRFLCTDRHWRWVKCCPYLPRASQDCRVKLSGLYLMYNCYNCYTIALFPIVPIYT